MLNLEKRALRLGLKTFSLFQWGYDEPQMRPYSPLNFLGGGGGWSIFACIFFFIKLSSLCSFFLTLSWWVSIRNLTLIVGSIYLSRDCWVILLLCNWNFPTELANFLCFCSCLTAIEASECPCNTRIYENIM